MPCPGPRRIWYWLKQVTVEPVLFLSFLAMGIYPVIQQVGMYRVVCEQTYVARPEVDCQHLANVTVDGVVAENVVQEQVAMWNMALGLAYMIPGFVADIFLGAYGDRYGRKVNMLLGMVGLMISLYPLVVLFTYPLMPMYILVIANVVTGFTGYISITMISALAYLADTVLKPEDLTVRMAAVTVIMNLASIIGPLVASAGTNTMTQAESILVCQAFLTAAFLLCMVMIRHVPPALLRRQLQERQDKKQPVAPTPPETPPKSPPGEGKPKETICGIIYSLLRDAWLTYTKPRKGHIRLYLLISASVFFLNTLSEGIRMTIITLFVQKAPLSWDQDMIGYYRSAQSAMSMVGTTFGVLVFKKLFKLTDTFVILIACCSHMAEMVLMAFSNSTWMVFTAAASGCLAMLAMPCTQSFLAKLVGPEETGKAFTAFGISANIAFLVSSAIYNPIYAATVSFFSGFVFLFATGIIGLAFVATLWMHIDIQFKNQEAGSGFWTKIVRSMFSVEEGKGSEGDPKTLHVHDT